MNQEQGSAAPDAVRLANIHGRIVNAQEDMGHYTRINIDPDEFSIMLDELAEAALRTQAAARTELDGGECPFCRISRERRGELEE